MKPKVQLRAWVAWAIGSMLILLGIVITVLIATHDHPPTTVNVLLNVSKISFRTDAIRILAPSTAEQLLIARISLLKIRGKAVQIVGDSSLPIQANSFEIEGAASASCTFYLVRNSGFELSGPSLITLGWARTAGGSSASLQVHGSLTGTLTSQPSETASNPGFTCTRVHAHGGPAETVEGSFSPQGGDSILFTTAPDARLVFDLTANSEIGDTQIPILDELRFSSIDPRTYEEKTVLLSPPAGYKNEISFEALNKTVSIDDSDILIVRPKRGFYLRQFTVRDGLQLSLHGVVYDVRTGAGANDLQT